MNHQNYDYLISEKYCENWSIIQGIREIVANALDARGDTEIEVFWDDQYGHVINHGSIMQQHHLLLGEGDKSQDQIGQFGEGLKLAALALARLDKRIIVKSGGFRYSFFLKVNHYFARRILSVDIDPCEMSDGTEVKFQCYQDELDDAKGLFRHFNHVPDIAEGILDAPGDVYVLGVKVCHFDNALFGYDLKDKALMNRDRTIVDHGQITQAVGSMLGNTDSKEVIERLINGCGANRDCFEAQHLNPYIPYSHEGKWKAVVKELFGDKVCVYEEGHLESAQYLGFKVINCGEKINKALTNWSVGLPWASQVRPEKITNSIPLEALNEEQKNTLEEALGFVEKALGRKIKATIVGTDDLEEETIAESDPVKQIIYLNTSLLGYDNVPKTIGTLFHEIGHLESYATDCTRIYEEKLTEYFKEIGENLRELV